MFSFTDNLRSQNVEILYTDSTGQVIDALLVQVIKGQRYEDHTQNRR